MVVTHQPIHLVCYILFFIEKKSAVPQVGEGFRYRAFQNFCPFPQPTDIGRSRFLTTPLGLPTLVLNLKSRRPYIVYVEPSPIWKEQCNFNHVYFGLCWSIIFQCTFQIVEALKLAKPMLLHKQNTSMQRQLRATLPSSLCLNGSVFLCVCMPNRCKEAHQDQAQSNEEKTEEKKIGLMQKGENCVCVSLSVRSSSGSKLVQ